MLKPLLITCICCKNHVLIGCSDDGRRVLLIQHQLHTPDFSSAIPLNCRMNCSLCSVARNIQMTINSKRMECLVNIYKTNVHRMKYLRTSMAWSESIRIVKRLRKIRSRNASASFGRVSNSNSTDLLC